MVEFTIPKHADAVIFGVMQDIQKIISGNDVTIRILGTHHDFGLNQTGYSELVDKITNSEGMILERSTTHAPETQIEFQRGADRDTFKIDFRLSDAATANKASAVSELLTKRLFARNDKGNPILSGHLTSPMAEQIIHSTVAQVEEVLKKVSIGLLETNRKLHEETDSQRKKLDEDYLAKRVSLDEAAERDRASLESERQLLRVREKELDDRNNTHVRRALLGDIKNTIKNRGTKFELTEETRGLRKPIHWACSIGLAVLLAAATYTGYRLTLLPNDASWTVLAIVVGKQLGLTVAFIALLAFYIRWMNRWFDKHAEAEFALKQFDLDIDRAAWLVETGLEWKKNGGVEIPPELLSGLSRNLFASQSNSHEELHPGDFIASTLLGNASAMELQFPGGKVGYQGKGVRNIAKAAENAE
jgi:hypothetical protein